MQSFYRRFVRDYMRYKDYIQCAGKSVLEEVRKDALAHSHGSHSDFYALHIRRGDFQFKVFTSLLRLRSFSTPRLRKSSSVLRIY
jgi:hypothetical protein